MRLFRVKFFAGSCAVFLLLGFGYYYREDVGRLLREVFSRWQPCQRPITYSLASLDPGFNLTEAEALNYIKRAEGIWEAPINKQLFEYSPSGDLKISFVYDYRQKATDALRKIGLVINDNMATYDALRTRYDLLIASYNQKKAELDSLVVIYNADKSAFEKDVAYWNGKGGAPKAQYNILEQQRLNLNNQAAIINQTQSSLNGLVETINSTETILNKLVATLNLKVSTYNAIGSSADQEFREGEYVRDASGTAINIFQFNDTNQLMEVLAHEFGHALGLGHLDNPKAIMYYLNEGANENLTTDDLIALKEVCGIK